MGWIGSGVGGLVDAEGGRVEAPALDHCRAGAVGGIGGGQVGQIVVVDLDPALRQPPERPAAGQDDVKQRCGIIGVREPAGQAYDSEWLSSSGRVSHGAVRRCAARPLRPDVRLLAGQYGPEDHPESAVSKYCESHELIPRASKCASFPRIMARPPIGCGPAQPLVNSAVKASAIATCPLLTLVGAPADVVGPPTPRCAIPP